VVFVDKTLSKLLQTLIIKKRPSLLLILPILLLFTSFSPPDVYAQSSPSFGLQRTEETIKLEQNDAASVPSQIIISPKNGFSSTIDLTVSIEPPTKFLEVKINGESSPKIDPKKDPLKLETSIHTDDRIPPGDYKVKVTATSIVNGQKITRTQSFVVKIIPLKEFSMEVKPSQITIPQGGQGSANIKTVLKKLLSESFELYALMPPGKGLSVSLSGTGEFLHLGHQSGWYLPPKTNQDMNTKLQIKSSPDTPPAKYTIYAVGKMTDDTIEHLSTYKTYTLPVIVTVTKNPEFSHLQNPALFDITPEFHKMTINTGSIGYNDIQIWSERPDEQITFDVSVAPAGQGVAADINEKRIIPKNPPSLGPFVTVAVSEDAKAGTYKVIVTGKSSALSGKESEQIAEFEVVVPKKKSSTSATKTIKESSEKVNSKLQDQSTKKQSDATKKTIKKTDQDKSQNAKPKTSTEYDPETIKGLFQIVKWAEYSQMLLLDAINQYNKELKTQIKQNEQEYADTKDKSLMDAVIENKDEIKKNDADIKNLIKIEEKLRGYESEIKKEANKHRILPDDLNKAAEEPITKIEIKIEKEDILKLLEGRFDEAKKSESEIEDVMLDLAIIIGPKLAGSTPKVKTPSIEDIEWHFDGEVCDGRVTIIIEWKMVGADGKHLNKPDSELVSVVEDSKPAKLELAKNTGKLFKLDHTATFEPKKGVTVTFKLFKSASDPSNLNDRLYETVTVKVPACLIDSVVDDLQPIVVIDQDGDSRKDEPKLVSEITKTTNSLKEIREKVKDRVSKSEIQDKPSQTPSTTQPAPSTVQPTPSQTPATQPTQKTVKLADKGRSAVQHSADPCLTTHTVYYQFAFTSGGYPQGDKITITESGFRGNLVHQGTLDSQGKYQIIIQNPPMQPGFEFRLTNYESSSGNKLETTLPNVWQFNVGPCIYTPPSQPPPEQQSGGGTGQIYFVQVYGINGKDYPIYQFVSSPPDSCNDYHFHATGGKAYAIDGSILYDPAPSGCGFGKTNSMGFKSAGVYKSQITAWESLTGINIPEDD
jgi:hypothetical protein